ncbi:WD40 repeat domain-containing protein, partial [Streptomyces sp. NPDC057621]|uniref:WD40 repeat domain-containing protein n=1 Tax=Streptomyces sp. NPDC057621 TaxID=3346186 RepID=UPI0036AC521A
TADHRGVVRIWDRATGTCTTTLTGRTQRPVHSMAIAPDSTWLALHRGAIVRLWDRATETWTSTLTGHMQDVYSVAIAPDGTWLASADYDGVVRIWDRATGTCTTTLTGHTGSVHSVAIAPDGTWLATAGNDGTVRIWSVSGQRTVAIARAEGALFSCSWGPTGELAVGGDRGLFVFTFLP